MNHLHSKECCYCGSSMQKRQGKPHCSGDNLPETKQLFDSILSSEFTDRESFSDRIGKLQYNELVFDLFTSYWKSKKEDSDSPLICLHEETYYRDVKVEDGRLPMPEPFIPFPDLVEVYIAEIMLGRELTGLEKDGRRHIPKISEAGQIYFGELNWVRWPIDYISLKDMYLKTDYNEPLMPVIFNMEDIRNIYSNRDGNKID